MPRVSTIIPSYNCAQFVGRAVDSALQQTYRDQEIIVIDDGSTDDTRAVMARFGTAVRYARQDNGGVSRARNHGLSLAGGEFVAYLDADDLWYPDKLEKQIAFLDTHSECGFVHTDVDVVNEDGAVIRSAFNHSTQRSVPRGRCVLDLLRESHVQILTVVARRELVERAGRFDARFHGVEDYLQWILIGLDGAELGYIDEPLAAYRWTAGSISSNKRHMYAQMIKMFTLLLAEKPIAERCGEQGVAVVRKRLYDLGRDLAYLERLEGDTALARRRLLGLIKTWPFQPRLYTDLVKATLARSSPKRDLPPG
jgi:glycosyltransferase involved in cell wall biosynthesis